MNPGMVPRARRTIYGHHAHLPRRWKRRTEMIQAVIERCAGIDVGKATLAVCVMTGAANAEPSMELRQYGTVVSELEALARWLAENQCTHVVMESTGWYWKPVYNILEEQFIIVLANPQEVRQRKG